MDDVTDAIGQLSMEAKEWKPSSQRSETTTSAAAPSFTPTSPPPPPRTSVMRPSPPGQSPNIGGASTWEPLSKSNSTDWNPTKDYVPSSPSWRQQNKPPEWGTALPEQQANPESQGYTQVGDEMIPNPPSTRSTVPVGPVPPPPVRTMQSMGVSDELWRYQRDVALESQREMDPTDPRHKAVPLPFTNPYQLDDIPRGGGRSSFGYPTSVFKVTNVEDGNLYCLRRVDNVRSVSYKIASSVTDRWSNAPPLKSGLSASDHPGVARFYRCFVSNRAVFFLHEYVPGARTLREQFMQNGIALPEPLIWSCISQLVAAIRAVHAGNLACRVLHLNHVLVTTPDGMMDRISLKLNCLGVVDALEFETRKQVQELQLQDMRDLGRLILSLASGMEITRNSDAHTMRRCEAHVGQNYSREVHNLAFSLLTPNSNTPTIHEVSRAISGRVFDELDLGRVSSQRTEAALAGELESGRALRLLLKLGFVNERPEFGMNRRWTESGDCYVLKLFRDYVFHQADGAGQPIMDLGHVVTALNKLDAADEEKILLASRDGKSMFVVSFADVARCLDSAFNELCGGAVLPGSLQY